MRHEKLFTRDDGTLIRLVAEYWPYPTGGGSVVHYALVKTPNDTNWNLFSPHNDIDKSLGGLSVDEYVAHGRKGLMAVVRPHEIIKATQELYVKLSV